MKRILSMAVVSFLVMVVLSGVVNADSKYDISGIVVDVANGQPIDNAMITITKLSPSWSWENVRIIYHQIQIGDRKIITHVIIQYRRGNSIENLPTLVTYTNSNGYFEFKDIERGDYMVVVTAEGYYPYTTVLLVRSDITLTIGLISLPREVYTLDGTILDINTGAGIENAYVELSDGVNSFVTYSDSFGYYKVENVPENIYIVTVTHDGYYSVRQRIELNRDKTINISLSPVPVYNISATICDSSTGDGISTAISLIEHVIDNVIVENWTMSGEMWNLSVSSKGIYRVMITAPDYSSYSAEFYLNSDIHLSVYLVSKVEPLFFVEGKVYYSDTAKGVDKAQVVLSSDNEIYMAVTSSSGEYRIENVKGGRYILTVSHPSTYGYSQNVDVTGNLIINIPLQRIPSHDILGTVRDEFNNPIVGARVELYHPLHDELDVYITDENGHFFFGDLTEEEYTLTVKKDGYSTWYESFFLKGNWFFEINLTRSTGLVEVDVRHVITQEPIMADIILMSDNVIIKREYGSYVKWSDLPRHRYYKLIVDGEQWSKFEKTFYMDDYSHEFTVYLNTAYSVNVQTYYRDNEGTIFQYPNRFVTLNRTDLYPLSRQGYTDSSGKITFWDVVVGSYSLRVGGLEYRFNVDSEENIRVMADNYDNRFREYVVTSVSGRVTYNGQPLENAVKVELIVSEDWVFLQVTMDYFFFDYVPIGERKMRVSLVDNENMYKEFIVILSHDPVILQIDMVQGVGSEGGEIGFDLTILGTIGAIVLIGGVVVSSAMMIGKVGR